MMKLNRDQKAQVRQLATEMAAIARSGQILPGSIGERLMVCGRSNCACHADPPRRHGPYWLWTRKIAAKTVGRYLSADQAQDCAVWLKNSRRLRELVASLEAIGVAALEADPRTGRGTPRQPKDRKTA
ncbi:MAG: DUF6788 family protein [Actinomycetota bacterium]